ncbi:MAG: monofunctional biosynthetic peptidoglycan transglycosylase [Acidobacteria bacterium]|nr:monofunctional biosynthetic peptidoglycan transglycosylase [Acidobacteriota bacterium]
MASARPRGGGGSSRRRRRLHRLLAGLAAALVLLAAWQAWTWPDVAVLATTDPETTAFIEAWQARQRAAGKPDAVFFRFVPYERIGGTLKRAVLVAEDIGFFDHRGFEVEELKKALDEAREELELPRGASTITQQLAKNLWLSPSRNPWRKAKEAALTWQLERHLTKRRILEIYLNVVEFGPGVYGAEAAARRYFGKPAAELSAHEAAQLAAGLPKPSAWHPGSASRAYARRVATIERRMERAQHLRKRI